MVVKVLINSLGKYRICSKDEVLIINISIWCSNKLHIMVKVCVCVCCMLFAICCVIIVI